jgi:chromosome segregation ATPase
MSDYQKQLKQHQTDIEQLKKQLPSLRANAQEAKKEFARSRAGRPVYPHEIVSAYNDAKTAIEEHTSEIKRLQILIDWEDGVRFANTNIKKAQKEISQAQTDLQKLQDKRVKLSTKLQKLENEKRTEIQKAQSAEQQAAAGYAVALSEGDDADEQRAEKLLKQASEALTLATRGKRGVATVVNALTAEVEKLDETIAVTKQLLTDLRQDQLRAARFLWADRLDKAAQDFANVAAQLSAAEKALGRYSSLQDLYLPLQAPMGRQHISQSEIREKADAISIEQLLAA